MFLPLGFNSFVIIDYNIHSNINANTQVGRELTAERIICHLHARKTETTKI